MRRIVKIEGLESQFKIQGKKIIALETALADTSSEQTVLVQSSSRANSNAAALIKTNNEQEGI